jgi:hypothetical protein
MLYFSVKSNWNSTKQCEPKFLAFYILSLKLSFLYLLGGLYTACSEMLRS